MEIGTKITITGVVGEIMDHGHDVNVRIDAPKGGPSIWMMGERIQAFQPGPKAPAEPTPKKPAKPRAPKKAKK